MKQAKDILTYGVIKKYGYRKKYKFNSIDIETINNEMFLIGYHLNDNYYYSLDGFFDVINNLFIKSVQDNRDILTWTRYDNHHILKNLLMNTLNKEEIINVLKKIGKISPLFSYDFKGYEITLLNVIKDSLLFEIRYGKSKKRLTIYNLKNLFNNDLLTVAQNYNLTYYSKLGEEYHIIDKDRFFKDNYYQKMVIKSNRLDSKVIIDIANKFLESYITLSGGLPKTIFTAGSIARSFLLNYEGIDPYKVNFRHFYQDNPFYEELLDYAMKAYHGGKIDSYILGYIKSAKVTDISSAYPSVIARLPELTNNVYYKIGDKDLDKYYYAFIRCDIYIPKSDFIHPLIVQSPIAPVNISPLGHLKDIIITKPEFDYIKRFKDKYNIKIEVKDYIAIEHKNSLMFGHLIKDLFNKRLAYDKEGNKALADLTKLIINSLYGITYELTPIYELDHDDDIERIGLRAGDFFNPIIASYITAKTRCLLSSASMDIINSGGKIYLHMTDSIIYDGKLSKKYYRNNKILGLFEKPEIIEDVIILGAGRYEYVKDNKYIIKNRGFNVEEKDKSFYTQFNINKDFTIKNNNFVTFFKATTKKYSPDEIGHIKKEEYTINPLNLGGKRLINEDDLKNTDLNKDYINTYPVYIDKYL